MKAMILAAGRGTRLQPLTDTVPKALVPVNGVPLLEHVILKLKTAGVQEIIVNIHHFGEQIVDFLRRRESFGLRIEVSDERDMLLDTGGGLQKAAWFFDDGQSFLLHNVDILSDLDLKTFRAEHEQSGALATLAVRHRETSRQLLFDTSHRLQGWHNRTTGETRPRPLNVPDFDAMAFSGIHLLRPEIFRYMQHDGPYSMIDVYLAICHQQRIRAYVHDEGWWSDVGKMHELQRADEWVRHHPQNTNP